MYLALFLTPWILMYALSTLAMNHRNAFKEIHGEDQPPFFKEREIPYTAEFSADAPPRLIAEQILNDLNMDGAHRTRMSSDGMHLIIDRADPVSPRRITYTPAQGRVLIERQVFRSNAFLERMHRRRGFQSDYLLDDAWALAVDLVIISMIFWVVSGLWMWWKMKATRLWGTAFALTGVVLFGLFLFTI